MKEQIMYLLTHTFMQFKGAWRASQMTFKIY
jgi:hypothetical protein